MREHRPSQTALKVAHVILYLSSHPRLGATLPTGAAEFTEKLLLAAGLLKPKDLQKLQGRSVRARMALAECLLGAEQATSLGLRKRFIDDEARAAIARGTRQLLVVGGGFDTLAARLSAEFPELRCIEIDHPATQKVKRQGLEKMEGFEIPPNLHLLPVDLTEISLQEALANCDAWNLGESSIVVVEGVLMYLHEAVVREFFSAAFDLTGEESLLLFSWMLSDAKGRVRMGRGTPIFHVFLRWMGEGIYWGVRDREALRQVLAEHGWELEDAEKHNVRQRYLTPLRIPSRADGVDFAASAIRKAAIRKTA